LVVGVMGCAGVAIAGVAAVSTEVPFMQPGMNFM
jgi:hypothetical protein